MLRSIQSFNLLLLIFSIVNIFLGTGSNYLVLFYVSALTFSTLVIDSVLQQDAHEKPKTTKLQYAAFALMLIYMILSFIPIKPVLPIN